MTKPQLQHAYLFKLNYLSSNAKLILSNLTLDKFEDFFDFFITSKKIVSFSKFENCGHKVENELNEFINGMIGLAKNISAEEMKPSASLFTKNQQLLFKYEYDKISARAKNVLFSFGVNNLDSFHKIILSNRSFEIPNIRNCGVHTINEIVSLKDKIIKSIPVTKKGISAPNLHEKNIALKEKEILKPIVFSGRVELLFDQQFDQLSTRTKNVLESFGTNHLKGFWEKFLNDNTNSINILRLKNCGDKTRNEIQQFQGTISKEIDKSSDFLGATDYFKDLQVYLKSGSVLRSVEQNIFINYYGFEKTEKRETLDEIASRSGLTNERIRQISIYLMKRVEEIALKVFQNKTDYLNKYFQNDFFEISNDVADEINKSEDTNFSSAFLTFVLDCIKSSDYDFVCIEPKNNLYSGIFVKKDFPIDFQKCSAFIGNYIGIRRKEDLKFDIRDLVKAFRKDPSINDLYEHRKDSIISAISLIASCFSDKKDIIVVVSDSLILKRNTKRLKYEFLVDILNNFKKPMHYTEIYDECLKNGIKSTSPLSIHGIIQHHPKVFGLKGPGIYGLIEWGGYFGTIGDVTEKILRERNEPIDRRDLIDILCRELYISQDSISTVLFNYEPEQRFVKMRNDTVGLRNWTR